MISSTNLFTETFRVPIFNSHLPPLLTKAKVVSTKGAKSSNMNRRLNIRSVLESSITRIRRSPSQTDEAYLNFVFPATIPE